MEVNTKLTSMGPLSICLYYFTLATIALYPNLFIPAFEYIFVNMTSVDTFMNESIQYFDSFYLIKISRLVFLPIKRHHQLVYSCAIVLPFWSNLRAPQDFIVFLF